MNAARSLSRRQLCGASRVPSRHGANGARSSTLPISSPGLSSPSTSSVRFFRTLELRRGESGSSPSRSSRVRKNLTDEAEGEDSPGEEMSSAEVKRPSQPWHEVGRDDADH